MQPVTPRNQSQIISTVNAHRALAAATLFLVVSFALLNYIAPGGRRLVKVTGIDTVNYFGIAHSVLFDHDFDLNNEYQHVPPDDRYWTPTNPATGLPGSPWGVGYSLLATPLLALGTALDWAAGRPPDGYGPFALYLYRLTSLLLTGLGLRFLFDLLLQVARHQGAEEDRAVLTSFLATLAVFLGTNIGYYAIAPIAHAGTFLFASLFLCQWWKVRSEDRIGGWFLLGLAGGWLSICRWQDVLYLGGPILYDILGGRPFRNPVPWLKARLAFGLAVFLCWLPQIAEWKAIYGKFLTMPQGGGFMKFPPASVFLVLFSSRNGWFLWTPLIFLGVLGLTAALRRDWKVYAPWIVVASLELLVIGALTAWHGYDSFSSRYMLANTPLAAMGLVALLCAGPPVLRRGAQLAAGLCTLFGFLFAVQYGLKLIPNNETLTPTEIFAEKLYPFRVHERKVQMLQGRAMLAQGHPAEALRVLEQADALGDDRDVLPSLARAYRLTGDDAKAAGAESRRTRLLESRLP